MKNNTACFTNGPNAAPRARWIASGVTDSARSGRARRPRSLVTGLNPVTSTRESRKTVLARAQRDARFRQALFTEAINGYLAGDTRSGKAILRDLVNATVGFEALAAAVNKSSKSLHRMLAPHGNPSTEKPRTLPSASTFSMT
jgi:hypothetical protein